MIGRLTEVADVTAAKCCKWCRVAVPHSLCYGDFAVCDRCWELETRIRNDRVLARKKLEAIEAEK